MHKLHWPSVKVLCIGHYGVIGKAKGCDTLDLLANTLPNSPIGQTKITMWVSSKCGTILQHHSGIAMTKIFLDYDSRAIKYNNLLNKIAHWFSFKQ